MTRVPKMIIHPNESHEICRSKSVALILYQENHMQFMCNYKYCKSQTRAESLTSAGKKQAWTYYT